MDERQQSVSLDVETGRSTMQVDGAVADVMLALDAPRPEKLHLQFDDRGCITACSYEGFAGKQVLEHISRHRSFRLNANLVHLVVIFLMVFSVVYLMARQYVARSDRAAATQAQQFLH